MTESASRSSKLVLAREVSEFLLALSRAFQRYVMYPDGHPSAEAALKQLRKKLDALFLERGSIAIGVAPTQLIISGVSTDPKQTLLHDLASHLHRHDIGGVKLHRGVKTAELNEMLREMTRDVAREGEGQAAVTEPVMPKRQWEHARLYPLSYDQLAMLEEDDDEERTLVPDLAGDEWAGRLWLRLARNIVGGDLDEAELAALDPAELAKRFESRGGDWQYDASLLESMTEFTDACKTKGRSEAAGVQRHLARLIKSLQPETLVRLMTMNGDEVRRRDFLLDTSQVMTADAAVDLVKAAAQASDRSISPALLGLLLKFSDFAESSGGDVRGRADDALRDQLRLLIERWRLGQPAETNGNGSGGYQDLVRHLPRLIAEDDDQEVYGAEPERIVAMSLESGLVEPGTLRAVDSMILRGEVARLLEFLDHEESSRPVVRELRPRVVSAYTVTVMLGRDPVDLATLDRLIPECGLDALEPMLDALATAKDRKVRATLLELLARFGDPVGVEIVARIPGAPWFVQRNLLKLLAMLPTIPEAFSPSLCLAHPDARVRHEGLKVLLQHPDHRERAILEAVKASDMPSVRLGLQAAQDRCPAPAVPIILRRIDGNELEPDLRALGIRAIASVEQDEVLVRLLALVHRRWLLFFHRLALKSPEMLAALAGLSIHWRGHPQVEPVLAQAEHHKDKDVREAAGARPRLAPPGPQVIM